MKHRTLYSNICSIVIILALVVLLLAYSGIIGGGRDTQVAKALIATSLTVAIVAVTIFDIILPVIDNRACLKNKKYIIKLIVKVVLFACAMILAILTLYSKLPATMNEMVALGAFVVLYFAQFFLNLDPKVEKKKVAEKVVLDEEEKNEATDENKESDADVKDEE